ncbi:hypothetical protein GIB67_031314 [Kingdonia uniflora]|uniref:Large ribosomal subunit protein bL28c n=1 Tax=Kingdonia uniflora TaxID=39325 RepID=A0A7J7P621_9MAGN|nr:hypothetical protein GIB67_031314 [Kingdonia uniflora]
MVGLMNTVKANTAWVLGDGNLDFWSDNWTGEGPLQDLFEVSPNQSILVKDAINNKPGLDAITDNKGSVHLIYADITDRPGPDGIADNKGRICPFTEKKANRANKVSFSNHETKKLQFVNLQYKRVWWEAGNRYVKLRLSTKALKTIEKNGLDTVAKKAGIDLRKE